MKKHHLWILFFVAIFGFTFAMIIWTVTNAVKVDIHEDQSFLSTYHDVDYKFNDMMASNIKFNNKYDIELMFNDKKATLNVKDVFLSQRALEAKSKHKNMLRVGQNSIKVLLKDKDGNNIENAKIDMLLTMSTINYNDIKLKDFVYSNNIYSVDPQISTEGNWNITGTIEVDQDKGYFYFKTKSIN